MTSRFGMVGKLDPVAILLALGLSWLVAIVVHPIVGLVVAALLCLALVHPFEPFTALAALSTAASFADNNGGRMTRDLALITIVAVYALAAIAIARLHGRWRNPGGVFVMLLAAFLGWTAFSAVRGAMAGYSLKFMFLEIAALGTMAFTWLAGGLRMTAAELRPARTILILGGLGHIALGGWSYAVNHVRTGGIWYTPLPGMFAVMALAFALHTSSARARWAWTLFLGLCLWHQVISFSRGYWIGLLVALPWTAWMYGGRGDGTGVRWRRVLSIMTRGGALVAACTIVTAACLGWSDVTALLGTRFGSSFATHNTSESSSNMARILEYAASAKLIAKHPWIGYGLGLEIRIRQPFFHVITRQWYIHHTYLWLCLKEGLIGVALLLGLLWQAVKIGSAGARSADPETAAWCLTAAGATVYLSIVDLTTYHLANVNATMFQSLLWGVALALSRPVHWRLVWRAQPATVGAPAATA